MVATIALNLMPYQGKRITAHQDWRNCKCLVTKKWTILTGYPLLEFTRQYQ